VKELTVKQNTLSQCATMDIVFDDGDNWDEDDYPVKTTLQILARFRGKEEPRMIEKDIVISPPIKKPPKPDPILFDEPTFLKVAGRQLIKFYKEGPDLHVKLKWDGKDYLAAGNKPIWFFEAKCTSEGVSPTMTFSRPKCGKFELLIQIPTELSAGAKLEFEVVAFGPENRILSANFEVEVVKAHEPRKISSKIKKGSQRRSLYDLRYIKKDGYHAETCWGATTWTEKDPGCFQEPTSTASLILIINEDMDELELYRTRLIEKKYAETTIDQRKTNYVSHIAFHLYQMYKNAKQEKENEEVNGNELKPEEMRKEIRRVAITLLKLMEA